jgi:TIR domain
MATSARFDVFLSHNSSDKPAVRELASALSARGLRVWFDEWELVPGRPWQEALERVIRTVHSAAVLVGPAGIGPWEEPEMRACLSEFVRRRLPVIPVLLPGTPTEPELPMFLAQFTWVDLRDGITPANLERLQWGITGVKRGDQTTDQSAEHEASFGDQIAPVTSPSTLTNGVQTNPEEERFHYEVVFTGDFVAEDDARINSLLVQLQSAAEDTSLRIVRRRVGSLHLTLDGLRSGFVRLLMRNRSGELSRRIDRPVQVLRRLQLVILLHGIMTRAEWLTSIRSLLEDDDVTVVEPCGYGFFSALGLWFPFVFRQLPISVVESKLRDAISRHESERREIIVIAHSYGTYILSQILRSSPDIEVDRVLFCGSIVRENYRWDQLPNRPDQVVNEAGSRDIWPILAKSCSWGYGTTGTFGFLGFGVEDRFHNLSHSDFFKTGFAERFWKPWVHDNVLTRTEFEKGHRPPTPLWESVLAWLPLQWIGTLALAITLAAVFLRAGQDQGAQSTSVHGRASADLVFPDQGLAEPGVPIVADARPAQLNGKPILADSARFAIVLAHNQRGNLPIRISRIEARVRRVEPSERQKREWSYSIDASRLPGFGIVKVKRYVIDIWNDRMVVHWIKSRDADGAIDVSSNNLLESVIDAEAVTVTPMGDDAHYEFKGLIDPKDLGLYYIWFVIYYNVGGESRTEKTNDIVVYQN